MKTIELRKLSLDELKKMISDQARQKFLMRIQKGMGEAPKPHLMKHAKKTMARLLTIITEKERQA
jgi:large subunit ribosomal protein L29